MQKQKEEEFSMVKTSTRIVGALALAGALVCSGPALAAKPGKGGGPGMLGVLSSTRDSVVVKVPVDCDPVPQGSTNTKSETLSVKIFQSVGRLLNIGIFSVSSSEQQICTGGPTEIEVTVKAIPGLTFQPGPATILIKLTETTTTPPVPPALLPTVDVHETESGARIDLH